MKNYKGKINKLLDVYYFYVFLENNLINIANLVKKFYELKRNNFFYYDFRD